MSSIIEFLSEAYRFTPPFWIDRLFGKSLKVYRALNKDSEHRTREDFELARVRVAIVSGVCGADLQRMLGRYGISLSGRGFLPGNEETGTPKSLFFYVPKKQKGWTKYLLASAGCTVLNDPDAAGEARASSERGMPPPWKQRISPRASSGQTRKKSGPIDRIIDALWR